MKCPACDKHDLDETSWCLECVAALQRELGDLKITVPMWQQEESEWKNENAALRAKITELEADRERAWTHYAECAGTPLMADVMGERDRLRARVAELEAALELHWEHAIRCPARRVTEDDDSSCTCGLWQILTPKQ